jgi:hypothetical protein
MGVDTVLLRRMAACRPSSRSEAALEGRFSQGAARDILQDLNGIQTLRAEAITPSTASSVPATRPPQKIACTFVKTALDQELLRCSLLPPVHAIELAAEKIANRVCNFLSVRFERKMPGVVELHLRARIVALECFGSWRKEKWIVLSPNS